MDCVLTHGLLSYMDYLLTLENVFLPTYYLPTWILCTYYLPTWTAFLLTDRLPTPRLAVPTYYLPTWTVFLLTDRLPTPRLAVLSAVYEQNNDTSTALWLGPCL